ncbi:CPBP family intramembrane metalloprotease [Blastopirellula sp. J2-11]|uniref:CPBP family intramembrane glutamic endopeptidase n=1 Tax=Blastopirellula sp. J2-11 TaxID=2943192 RepID=UPI0021C99866|nr:CPBP family intramembrane glutamic endopeptidase [Blastopirellula sp. J2-11]UUO09093.1 CPBP family intramembrane metalloprotease [Blastopirellula sp. J2-11]
MGQIIFGFAVLCLMALLLVICISGWSWSLRQLLRGEPILRQETGEPISWGLIDIVATIVIALMLMAGFQGIAMAVTGAKLPIKEDSLDAVQQAAMILAFSGAELLSLLAVSGLIVVRGYGLQLFGHRGEKFFADLLLGIAAFGMLVVPTLILQAILAYLKPYEHPLIDMLIKDKSVPMAVASVAAAVVAAPLFEEFFFRGLFQGWLQDTVDGRLKISNVLLGRVRWLSQEDASPPELVTAEVDSAAEQEPKEEIITAVSASGGRENPFDSPTTAPVVPTTEYESLAASRQRSLLQICGPILLSASFFALMHLGQGLAPIPLFFLALGLGYLYQRTRRLTPCVVVHFLLNGQSMALLLIQVFVLGEDAALIAN